MTIDQTLKQAIAHHQAGELQDAERLYRAILQIEPNHQDANNNLGVLAVQMQQPAASLSYFKTALKANTNQWKYWLNYIDALIQTSQNDIARQMLELGRQQGLQGDEIAALAMRLEGNAPVAEQTNAQYQYTTKESLPISQAVLQSSKKKFKSTRTKADKSAKKSARHKGKNPSPQQINALMALLTEGRYAEAVTLAQILTVRFPLHEFGWKVLGALFQQMGRSADALIPMQKSVALSPGDAEAYSNLSLTLKDLSRLDEAEICCRLALEIKPDYAEAHLNLGNTLGDMGRLEEAKASYQRALQIKPDYVKAHRNLGVTLQNMFRLDEAEASYRQALEIKPDDEDTFGNLLFVLNYHPDKSGEEIFEVYREYDVKFGLPYRSEWRPHNNRETQSRLKVGYVSPDFKKHPVRHFLEPLLAHHDKNALEIYAYAELAREDEVTARYKHYVDQWIPTIGLSDAALAERIRADGIDILVDLAGHTANNRLGVFARKPAPVSLSWLGYGYTTGLTAIDYFLCDEAIVPADSEGLFSEKPWRLETPCFFYRPAEDMGEVNPLPAMSVGYVTFGCLSRGVRINHRVIRVWSELLKRVEGAKLVIDSKDFRETHSQDILAEKFAAHGISRAQLQIGYHSPPWDILRGMDIGLDCFPHNSGTTLIESLYMGVPFVTLAGRPSVGRLGSCVLQGVGHPEWIAESEDDYVAKAVELASDLTRLSSIRSTLRNQIEEDPLRDEVGFVRKVEEAYRRMWKIWCETGDKT